MSLGTLGFRVLCLDLDKCLRNNLWYVLMFIQEISFNGLFTLVKKHEPLAVKTNDSGKMYLCSPRIDFLFLTPIKFKYKNL